MDIIKGANLGVAFGLEIAMLVGLGVWAFGLSHELWIRWALVALVIGLAVAAWAIWAAPKSGTRLAGLWLLAFKLVLFGITTALLAQAGHGFWAAAFAISAAVSLGLAQIWRQESVA